MESVIALANFGVFGIFFTTPQLMVPLNEPLVNLTAPFMFSAHFSSGRWENPEIPRVTAELTGSGMASMTLVRTQIWLLPAAGSSHLHLYQSAADTGTSELDSVGEWVGVAGKEISALSPNPLN